MAAEMGQERRRQPITRRCRYCDIVYTGEEWLPDRRASPPAPADTICPNCLSQITQRLPIHHGSEGDRRAYLSSPWQRGRGLGLILLAASLII